MALIDHIRLSRRNHMRRYTVHPFDKLSGF
jgi:hypothetical protein